jgi:hypothetical protein
MAVGSLLRWVMTPVDRRIPSSVVDRARPIAVRPVGTGPLLPGKACSWGRPPPVVDLRRLDGPDPDALGPPEGKRWSPFSPCLNRRNLWEG